MVPPESFGTKDKYSKYRENQKRYDLLYNFELNQGEWAAVLHESDAVGGNLKAILKKRYPPACKDDEEKRKRVAVLERIELQMSVPCNGHKGIGTDQQEYGV